MSYRSIIISLEDALDIVSTYDFSQLYQNQKQSDKIEPYLILFFYGLTYSNPKAFQPFKIQTEFSLGYGEYSDGETMEWNEPVMHFHPKLFEALTHNPTINNLVTPFHITDFDSHHYQKKSLPLDFKLLPNKETINLFLYEILISKENPWNEDEVNDAKNWVFDRVIQIKEKYHLDKIMSKPLPLANQNENKKLKI